MKVSQICQHLTRRLPVLGPALLFIGVTGVTLGFEISSVRADVHPEPKTEAASPASSTGSAPPGAKEEGKFEPPKSFTAKIYKSGSDHSQLLFKYDHVSVPTPQGYTFTNTYRDAEGNVAAVETTDVIRDGEQLRVHLYKMSQKQTGVEGSVEVKNGTAYFTVTKDGKTKKGEESVGDDLVVGPTLLSYLHHRHDVLTKGGKVKARFVVLDRLETVGFEYTKEKDLDYHGKKAMMIKMKPGSFIVAAVVNPLHFTVPMDGSRVWEVQGRTQLKLKDGDKLRDLDADTVYEY